MQPRTRLRWRIAAGIATLTLLIGAVETSRNYLGYVIGGRQVSWFALYAGNTVTWAVIAVLTPIPLLLARLAPLGRHARPSAILAHVAGMLIFTTAHTFGTAAYFSLGRGSLSVAGSIAKFGSFAVDLAVYAAIVGVVHALRFHREARDRELRESQLQTRLTEARLAALRGQLNPHFLFNTLNAISTMALQGQHESVVRTLGYLGELLRVSLDDDLPQEVTLGEELEFLERYLDIQRTRLGDRLTIRRDIDASVLDAQVPSMILQPIVENAIVHGVAKVPGPGEIRLAAARRGDVLTIDVTDSGPGFDGQPLARGVGLANTSARLQQLYGEAHALTTGRGDRGGARVSMAWPYRSAPGPRVRAAS